MRIMNSRRELLRPWSIGTINAALNHEFNIGKPATLAASTESVMAWTARGPGQDNIITAATWNTDVRQNLTILHGREHIISPRAF